MTASDSGVLARMVVIGHVERPSWDDVDEYVRRGKHRSEVERYAASDPDFAEVVRWMRNDLEAEEIDPDSSRTPAPRSDATPFPGAIARRFSSFPPTS